MATQERNSEMISLLKVDLVAKNESVYAFTAMNNLLSNMPGVIGLWTMGGISLTNNLYPGKQSVFDWGNDILGLGTTDPTGGGTITPALTVAQNDNSTAIAIVDKATNSPRLAINGAPDGSVQIYDRGSGSGWTLGMVQKAGDLYLNNRVGGPWIAFPYTTGATTWTDFDAGAFWQIGRYKKFGDMVYLQGLVKRSAGSGTTIGTLPLNYRPPKGILYATITNGGLGRIDVNPDGTVVLTSGTAGWVSFNLPPFSVV